MKICVTREKKNILDCLEDPRINARITLRWQDAGLHVLPMKELNCKVEEHQCLCIEHDMYTQYNTILW